MYSLKHLTNTLHSSILGFPRQGVLRDLKKATEAYWADKLSQEELLNEGKRLRLAHWKIQKDAGVDIIPSNDFAYYDHVLDHIQLFGVIPPRYSKYNLSQTDELFAMGRGLQKPAENIDVPALVSFSPRRYCPAILTHSGNGEMVRLKLPLR